MSAPWTQETPSPAQEQVTRRCEIEADGHPRSDHPISQQVRAGERSPHPEPWAAFRVRQPRPEPPSVGAAAGLDAARRAGGGSCAAAVARGATARRRTACCSVLMRLLWASWTLRSLWTECSWRTERLQRCGAVAHRETPWARSWRHGRRPRLAHSSVRWAAEVARDARDDGSGHVVAHQEVPRHPRRSAPAS
jgi:hypothetical protein